MRQNYFDNLFLYWEQSGNEIVADTCFLLSDIFMDKMYPALNRYNSVSGHDIKLSIRKSVLGEIYKLSKCSRKSDVRLNATEIITRITYDSVRGKNFQIDDHMHTSDFADADILSYIISERTMHHTIDVLTQDNGLFRDIKDINNLSSLQGSPVRATRFTEEDHILYLETIVLDYSKGA